MNVYIIQKFGQISSLLRCLIIDRDFSNVIRPAHCSEIDSNQTRRGADPGGGRAIGWLATPLFGSFQLEIKKGSKTINEAILSWIALISFGQVSPPPPLPFQTLPYSFGMLTCSETSISPGRTQTGQFFTLDSVINPDYYFLYRTF